MTTPSPHQPKRSAFAPLLFASAACAALLARPAAAQRIERGPGPLEIGGGLVVDVPQGAFGDSVGTGFGAGGHIVFRPERTHIFGIRLEAGYLNYGRETSHVPFSSTVGGRVTLDLTTTNNIVYAGIGPEIASPHGAVRPYVDALVGFSYLFTESSVSGSGSSGSFARSTNYDDGAFAWGLGGGVRVPVGGPRLPLSIDVGARYHDGGRASYLREGDIHDNPDGSLRFTPSRTDTNLLVFHIGVSYTPLRGPSRRFR